MLTWPRLVGMRVAWAVWTHQPPAIQRLIICHQSTSKTPNHPWEHQHWCLGNKRIKGKRQEKRVKNETWKALTKVCNCLGIRSIEICKNRMKNLSKGLSIMRPYTCLIRQSLKFNPTVMKWQAHLPCTTSSKTNLNYASWPSNKKPLTPYYHQAAPAKDISTRRKPRSTNPKTTPPQTTRPSL